MFTFHSTCMIVLLHLVQAREAVRSSADLQGHSKHLYEKSNMLYAGKAIPVMRAALRENSTVAVTLDEAAFLNADIMQIFASAPASAEVVSAVPILQMILHGF